MRASCFSPIPFLFLFSPPSNRLFRACRPALSSLFHTEGSPFFPNRDVAAGSRSHNRLVHFCCGHSVGDPQYSLIFRMDALASGSYQGLVHFRCLCVVKRICSSGACISIACSCSLSCTHFDVEPLLSFPVAVKFLFCFHRQFSRVQVAFLVWSVGSGV